MAGKLTRRSTFKFGAIAAATLLWAPQLAAQSADAGYTPLFHGNSFDGWRGDPDYFSVENGVLTAGSKDVVKKNTFLILDKPYGDFELRYRYRWATKTGNSGIQFRSGVAEGHFALAGMQANVTPIIDRTERFGMLYEELGDRAEMVLLGQKAEITRRAAGAGGRGRIIRTVLNTTNSREAIIGSIRPYPEWNDVVLIAYGDRIVHIINGLVAFDATDKDPLARRDGLIGIQVHAGEPMIVQFEDMKIRPLSKLPDLSGFTTHPGPAPEPTRTFKDSTKVAMPDEALPKDESQ